jgi:outer membrane protein, heavy metal efflux system
MYCRPSGLPARIVVRAPALSFLIAALAMPMFTHAAPIEITLDEAVHRAVQRAPTIDARRSQIEAAKQESYRATALPDPMLTVGIDNLPVTGPDAFDTTADFMTMKKIGLIQEIPARAKREARGTLAARLIDEATAQAEVERRAVQRTAADAWIELWTKQRELAALSSSREQAALAARIARGRVAGGADTAADALATEAVVLEIDNRIAAAEAALTMAQASLQRWLGDGEVTAATASPGFDRVPYAEAQVLTMLDQLPALRPVAAQLETAAAEVDLARSERRPDWSVAASYGQRSGGRDDMLMIEVGIGLPLFRRNRQDRGISAREADYQAALYTREHLRRQQTAQVRSAFAQWQGLQRQVTLNEGTLLPLARDRSATALASYRGGGELRPWLDARRDELAAELLHVQQLGELGRAWAALAFLLPTEARP